MKVVHLSLHDRYGGACIAAYRQHTALLKAGVDSQMWVRFKVTNDPHVEAFTPPADSLTRVNRIFSRQYLRNQHQRNVRRGVFLEDRTEHRGRELRGMPAADVVNVQSFWNFIHLPTLLETLRPNVPVIVTMHEMAPFTGGCAYSGDCIRFHQRCGKCPLLGGLREDDLSRRSWLRKRALFQSRPAGNLHFVADSHWLAEQARMSGLLAGLPVSVIHYGLDTEIFRPMNRTFVREALQVPEGMRVVSFAAAFVDDTRKGVKYLIEALRLLRPKPFLLTWGQKFPPGLEDIPHHHLGSITDEHLMALAYNASDVFVMPSLEEAFGQTALESIACGTPVVAFAAGGIVDTVRHEKTGLLAKVGNSQELSQSIARLLEDRTLWGRLSVEGRKWALEEFSQELNAQRYLALYQSVLRNPL